jgi:tRNA threonylcarbamoyladenosine biosynthesis protein TsaB
MASRMLAFDTSAGVTAVAVLEDDRVLAEVFEPAEERHAEILLPRIQDCLARSGVELREIDVFAVGIGPGSFTGVRVGVATAKGLALATGKPIRGVSSLAALAASALPHACAWVVPILDAYKGEVFAAAYAVSPIATKVVCPPFHAAPERAAAQIAEVVGGTGACVFGTGYRRYADRLASVWQSSAPWPARALGPELDIPRATELAREARRLLVAEGASDLSQLSPLYVRDSDAQLPKQPLRV